MNISQVVDHIGTSIALRRVTSAYVIDYRNLSDDGMREAVKKMAPQYYFRQNVEAVLNELFLREARQHRILSKLILVEVLLNCDQFTRSSKETDDAVLAYEQSVIDRSNEDLFRKEVARSAQLDLFRFVLETAWANNSEISPDEFNLIEKLRVRMKITEREHRILEALLNRFPNGGNTLHTRTEIEETRRLLQSKGVLFTIRNEDGTDFDIIPDEVAGVVREILGVKIKRFGYGEMLTYKAVRSKPYLTEVIQKCQIEVPKGASLLDLQQVVLEQVGPDVLLGGLSPKDGLEVETLKTWCADLGQNVSGTKAELIERLTCFYDNLIQQTKIEGDPRLIWYENFEKLASRDLEFLRSQQLIERDIDCETQFEEATDYLFEHRLNHKPLKLIGSSHADGVLSYRDKVILWDNKSKESPVHLKDHLKQFEGYIQTSERPAAGFWVIGPDFTEESQTLAMQMTVACGVIVTLIKASDLKSIAENWHSRNRSKTEDSFPLGFLIQPGLLNPSLVPAQ